MDMKLMTPWKVLKWIAGWERESQEDKDMDIRVMSQLTGAASGSAAAVVPADTRALISDIANSEALTESARSGLIAAAAQIDSGLTGAVRTEALAQVQGLGIYLRNSGTEGYPRWPMMTALRTYGMNLTNNGGGGQAAVISNLKSQLEHIAQGHGVSLQKAISAASNLPAAAVYTPPVRVPVKVEAPVAVEAAPTGQRVETIA